MRTVRKALTTIVAALCLLAGTAPASAFEQPRSLYGKKARFVQIENCAKADVASSAYWKSKHLNPSIEAQATNLVLDLVNLEIPMGSGLVSFFRGKAKRPFAIYDPVGDLVYLDADLDGHFDYLGSVEEPLIGEGPCDALMSIQEGWIKPVRP